MPPRNLPASFTRGARVLVAALVVSFVGCNLLASAQGSERPSPPVNRDKPAEARRLSQPEDDSNERVASFVRKELARWNYIDVNPYLLARMASRLGIVIEPPYENLASFVEKMVTILRESERERTEETRVAVY